MYSHGRKKEGRLIVRNINFKATEEEVQKHFEEYGTLNEVKLLRKPNNQLVGCGFIQFEDVKSAQNAIAASASGKPFLGRQLVLDWAVPKNVFKNVVDHDFHVGNLNKKPKESDVDLFNKNFKKSKRKYETKSFGASNGVTDTIEVKEERVDADEIKEKSNKDGATYDNDSTEGTDDDSDENTDDEAEQIRDKENPNKKIKQEYENPRRSNDVTEGLTVFLRNIPFSVDKDELKDFIKTRFGPVYYVVICMDAATEHSRGTGFVKFVNKESVNAILNAGEDLVLHDEVMQASLALSRDEINSKRNIKNKTGLKNDNRNLYLSKEGLILAGSNAANGVSINDMNKRLHLESIRSRLLRKNLLMFISDTRLVIYNLPPSFTDAKLKELFTKYSPKGAVITEARVIKDMKKMNDNGTLASREFGYVTFTNPEHALEALRNINNNPEIFSKTKRPIVLFSVENRQAIATKQKRLDKSKRNNPSFVEEPSKKKFFKKKKMEAKFKKNSETPAIESSTVNSFRGFIAAPGKNVLKSGFKIKKQAMTHAKNIKKSKKKNLKGNRGNVTRNKGNVTRNKGSVKKNKGIKK